MADLLPRASRRTHVWMALSAVTLVPVGLAAAIAAGLAARSGLGNTVVIPIGGITAITLLALFLGGYRLLGARRDVAVARRFSATEGVIFASGRTRDFGATISPYRADSGEAAIPYEFTAVCSADGVSFWTGPIVDPVSFAKISWECASRVTVDRVRIDQRHSRGLVLETVEGSRVELQPLGQGFLAMFPFSEQTLLSVAGRLNLFAATEP